MAGRAAGDVTRSLLAVRLGGVSCRPRHQHVLGQGRQAVGAAGMADGRGHDTQRVGNRGQAQAMAIVNIN